MQNSDPKPRIIIAQSTKKERIAKIQAALARDADEIAYFSEVGLRLHGPIPSNTAIDIAVNSANRQKKTKLFRYLKRHFLIAQFRWCDAFLRRRPDATLIVWNGIKGHRGLFALAATMQNRRVVYLEEAPFPKRITVDSVGVNFGSSLPRDIDFYNQWARTVDVAQEGWRAIKDTLKSRKAAVRKDVQHAPATSELADQKFIFCPLQVPGDSQITIYGDWIKSVEQFIDVVAKASKSLPEGWHLRIKEHPTSSISFAEKLASVSSTRLRVDNRTDTMQQVDLSQGVLTINSSVGLQAFFYDKPVLVLGHAFYTFDDLGTKIPDAQTLERVFSDPSTLTYNAEHRNSFMNYLDQVYYPTEEDVLSGKFDLNTLAQRDTTLHGALCKKTQR